MIIKLSASNISTWCQAGATPGHIPGSFRKFSSRNDTKAQMILSLGCNIKLKNSSFAGEWRSLALLLEWFRKMNNILGRLPSHFPIWMPQKFFLGLNVGVIPAQFLESVKQSRLAIFRVSSFFFFTVLRWSNLYTCLNKLVACGDIGGIRSGILPT